MRGRDHRAEVRFIKLLDTNNNKKLHRALSGLQSRRGPEIEKKLPRVLGVLEGVLGVLERVLGVLHTGY